MNSYPITARLEFDLKALLSDTDSGSSELSVGDRVLVGGCG